MRVLYRGRLYTQIVSRIAYATRRTRLRLGHRATHRAGDVVVLHEPLHGGVHRLLEGRELEVGEVLAELALFAVFLNCPSALEVSNFTCSLGMPIAFATAYATSMEISSSSPTERMMGSALFAFSRVQILELSQVDGVDELTQRRSGAPDLEVLALLRGSWCRGESGRESRVSPRGGSCRACRRYVRGDHGR